VFIQIIDFETDRIDEGRKYVEEYRNSTTGKRTATRGILTKDRDKPNRYLNLVFFESYDAAMKNSEMPETQELAEKLMKLSTGDPRFLNLEVLDDMEN
jgi:hypothetical protein